MPAFERAANGPPQGAATAPYLVEPAPSPSVRRGQALSGRTRRDQAPLHRVESFPPQQMVYDAPEGRGAFLRRMQQFTGFERPLARFVRFSRDPAARVHAW